MTIDNVNALEIEQFETMAPKWWDKNGPCKPLHDLNPTRVQFIKQHADLQGKHILDIGCGGGILTERLQDEGALVTGIDAAAMLIKAAQEHQKESSDFQPIQYYISTAEDFAKLHTAKFDIITCMELLEHVPDPQSLIHAISTLLKPNGQVFLSTLNRTPKSYALAIVGAEYLLKLLPKGTHTYDQFIKPSELNVSLENASITLKDLQGMHYNPFTRTASLGTDVSVNYLVYGLKIS